MCQLCLDAVARHYPALSEREAGELLMGATAFPFGSPEQIESQLAHVRAETDGTLEAALAFAGEEFERDWSACADERRAETNTNT